MLELHSLMRVTLAASLLLVSGCGDDGASTSEETERQAEESDTLSDATDTDGADSSAASTDDAGMSEAGAAATDGTDEEVDSDAGADDAGAGSGMPSSAPALDDLLVEGVRIPLKPNFDPSRRRYSVLADEPVGDLVVTATASEDLMITIDGQAAESGEPLELPDVEPEGEFQVVVENEDGKSRVYTIVYLPWDFPDLKVSHHESTASTDPIYLTIRRRGNIAHFVVKVDNEGVPLFYRREPRPVYDFKKHPNGQMSYALLREEVRSMEQIVLNEDFEEVDRVTTVGLEETNEHEFHILPNGNRILLSYETAVHDASDYGGSAAQDVRDGILQEVTEDGELLFEWNSWGYMPYDESLYGAVDYAHLNAVDVDTDGNWLVSSRGLSQVFKLDRSTGEVLWRFGGMSNEFEFIDDPFGNLCGQHTASRLENGNILLFDNGQYCWPEVEERGEHTRISEYKLDEEAMTAELVWSYHQEGAYCYSQGSSQRLDNGNTFIGWGRGTFYLATEVDTDGNIVFQILGDGGGDEVQTYRAWRFPD